MADNHSITVFIQGRPIGVVVGKYFKKRIRGSLHVLRFPRPAICFDIASLDSAEASGAQFVRVTDAETGMVYTASITHIRTAGFYIDRGHGQQIGLPLTGFSLSHAGGGLQLPLWERVEHHE